ncbi:MAG: hypothetical protein ACXIUW_01945, partial [Roseinatronobacter sp.]
MENDQVLATGDLELEESFVRHLGLQAEFFALAPNSVRRLSDIDFTRDPDATGAWEAFDIYRTDDPFWE